MALWEGFESRRHPAYFEAVLREIPSTHQHSEPNRITIAHFAITSLNTLNQLSDENKAKCVEWVYGLQRRAVVDGECGGFRGGSFAGSSFSDVNQNNGIHDLPHIAMTYSALVLLRVCGDDYSRVDRAGIITLLRELQLPEGGYKCHPGDCEEDLRFLYCAAAISHFLDDWSGINIDRAVSYIQKCQNYDGGIGMNPNLESHGGAAYCGLSALRLMNKVDAIPDKRALIRWCLDRQVGGFQGRRGKDADTCYCFWLTGALHALDALHFVDKESTFAFVQQCENHKTGGFSKFPGEKADILHSHFSLCGISVIGTESLKRVNPTLGFAADE